MTATVEGHHTVRHLRTGAPDPFANITPNWFAAVMGTGIIAIALAGLPVAVPGAPDLAAGLWLVTCAVLASVIAATAVHWHRHPDRARRHLVHPVFAHFYGAVPMALMTVGTGAVLAGRHLVGLRAALELDWVLWTVGTAGGLVTMVGVPAVLRARHIAGTPFPGWLIAVVPPVVSGAAGAQLASHCAGAPRVAMVIASYLLVSLGLVASGITVAPVARHLLRHGLGGPAVVPTLWILLGPLGQSITACTALGRLAGPDGRLVGLVYACAVGPLAAAGIVLASAVTARQAARGLPFGLSWWSFTVPLGTCVTAASGLSGVTGSASLRVTALALCAALLGAWCVVARRTVAGIISGELLRLTTAPSQPD